MVGETGFEPATLCSQITRLLFGFNGVCHVSPYVPPYSTQWVSAPVTNRSGAFLTKERRPRHWRSRRKSRAERFTHALCTSFSGSLQGLNALSLFLRAIDMPHPPMMAGRIEAP